MCDYAENKTPVAKSTAKISAASLCSGAQPCRKILLSLTPNFGFHPFIRGIEEISVGWFFNQRTRKQKKLYTPTLSVNALFHFIFTHRKEKFLKLL